MISINDLKELCSLVKTQASEVREYRDENKAAMPEAVLQTLYKECDRLNRLEEVLCAEIAELQS